MVDIKDLGPVYFDARCPICDCIKLTYFFKVPDDRIICIGCFKKHFPELVEEIKKMEKHSNCIVYSASCGYHPDYNVLAIFSTKELAINFLEGPELAKQVVTHCPQNSSRETINLEPCRGTVKTRWEEGNMYLYCSGCHWKSYDSYRVEEFDFNPTEE